MILSIIEIKKTPIVANLMKTTYLLIHGACQGGWSWQPLLPYMKNKQVVTPTLTGGGERSHLLSPWVSMETHIEDICQCIKYAQLNNIVLVGHSYAGLILAGVISRYPSRIRHAIFLDAFVPIHYQTGLEIIGEPYASDWQQHADLEGDGWRLITNQQAIHRWGVSDAKAHDFIRQFYSDWSINLYTSRVHLDRHFHAIPKTYIRCMKKSYCFDLMEKHFQQAQREHFNLLQIPSDHEAMITHPKRLAILLESIGNQGR